MKLKINLSDVALPLVALIALLIIWQVAVTVAKVPTYVLPSPTDLYTSYMESGSEVWINFKVTLLEAALGVLVGSAFGFIIGVSMAESKIFQKISLPFLIGANAVPVVALAPIIVIWFGNSLTAKVMVAAFISFFPIALNTYKGLGEYRQYYKELFAVYGSTRIQFLLKYKLGNALPFIITGLKLNSTLSVIGAIVGEFISADKGLGFGILQANYNFNSPKLWVYIFLACLIGIGFYTIILIIEKLFLHNFKTNEK